MLGRIINEWYELLLSVFFSRQCAGCGQIAESGLLCGECRKAVNEPLWLDGREYLDGVIMLFRYAGPFKHALQAIKFSGKGELLPLLAAELEMALLALPDSMQALWADTEAIIVPVPTSMDRQLIRGFDVPQILFAGFERRAMLKKVLERNRETLPLYGLNPQERRFNLEDCFTVIDDVRNKTVIIVDDIFTTGSTMDEAARTLKAHGAVVVYGLAFCGSIENYNSCQ